MANDINDSYINTNEYNRKNSLAHSLLMGCHVIGLSTSATSSVMKDGLWYSQVFLSRFSCGSVHCNAIAIDPQKAWQVHYPWWSLYYGIGTDDK